MVFFLKKFFDINEEILEIEFRNDKLIFSVKDFWWFVKRKSISYDLIINIILKTYQLELIEKYDLYELQTTKKTLSNLFSNNVFVIKKSDYLKIELFLKFLNCFNEYEKNLK